MVTSAELAGGLGEGEQAGIFCPRQVGMPSSRHSILVVKMQIVHKYVKYPFCPPRSS